MNLGSANPKEVEGIINFPKLGLSHDLGKGAKRAISPTLIEENNRVAKVATQLLLSTTQKIRESRFLTDLTIE